MRQLTAEGELLLLLARICREHMHDYLQGKPINRRAFAATCDRLDDLLLRINSQYDDLTGTGPAVTPTLPPAVLPSHSKK